MAEATICSVLRPERLDPSLKTRGNILGQQSQNLKTLLLTHCCLSPEDPPPPQLWIVDLRGFKGRSRDVRNLTLNSRRDYGKQSQSYQQTEAERWLTAHANTQEGGRGDGFQTINQPCCSVHEQGSLRPACTPQNP